MFTVTVDLERGLLEATISGFWTLGDVAAFGEAIHAAAERIAATGRKPVSLCDYTGAAVQSQEVFAAFQALIEKRFVRSRRVALFTTGAMAKMQAARATRSREAFRLFTDRAEAERWLFAA